MLKIVILTSEINSHVASCPSEGGLGTSRTDITWEQTARAIPFQVYRIGIYGLATCPGDSHVHEV